MANIRVLATDLEFPEGPVVMPDGSVVISASMLDSINDRV